MIIVKSDNPSWLSLYVNFISAFSAGCTAAGTTSMAAAGAAAAAAAGKFILQHPDTVPTTEINKHSQCGHNDNVS